MFQQQLRMSRYASTSETGLRKFGRFTSGVLLSVLDHRQHSPGHLRIVGPLPEGRPSLARVLPSGLTPAGPGWLRASGAGAHGGPRRGRTRWWGPQWSSKTSGHRCGTGPAPCVGCERSFAPSAGARGGHPTTAAPKLYRGTSLVKERRTAACVAGPSCDTHSSSGLGGPHIFMGTPGPSERWGPDLRGRSGRKAQGRSMPLAPRSALPHCGLTRRPGGDSPASGRRQTAPRSA